MNIDSVTTSKSMNSKSHDGLSLSDNARDSFSSVLSDQSGLHHQKTMDKNPENKEQVEKPTAEQPQQVDQVGQPVTFPQSDVKQNSDNGVIDNLLSDLKIMDPMSDAMVLAQNMSAAMAMHGSVEKTHMVTTTVASDMPVVVDAKISKDSLPTLALGTLLNTDKPKVAQPTTDNPLDILPTAQPLVTTPRAMDSIEITKPLTHPDWSKDLGSQILWMNNKDLTAAEIKLNPEHLGPISVRIDLTQDQASIQFTAQHDVVKEAIEASIPKLREMLDSQQLNLTAVTISQSNMSGQGQAHPQQQNNTQERKQVEEDVTPEQVTINNLLLSIYA